MVSRIVVGAHYGLRGWLLQRVSAAVMALYTLLILGVVLFAPPRHYGEWIALFARQWMKLATFLFFASLLLHAWVGMRDILMDYVKPTGWRLAAQAGVIVWLAAHAGWVLQILWGA
jgi:succinate dehydrogenase / fumarate reductase membrane anchor subunit